VNIKYLISIVAILAVIHYLLAGSATPATTAPVASQAKVAPIAPTPVAPNAPVGPVAPIGPQPVPAPVAPVTVAPIAPTAPATPTPPQSANSAWPAVSNAYTYAYGFYGTNNAYFTNGIPTAYLRNTNSVAWATNPPYGNPSAGYTNFPNRVVLPYQPGNTSSPSIQQK
jgi:hypothetical protein